MNRRNAAIVAGVVIVCAAGTAWFLRPDSPTEPENVQEVRNERPSDEKLSPPGKNVKPSQGGGSEQGSPSTVDD